MLEDFHARGIYLTEDEYRTGLRSLFSEDYQEFSDEELEDIIYETIAELSPAEAESLIEGLGSWFKKAARTVAPIVTAALPAVATVAGTALGGPLGGMAAGAAGNLAAGAISKATRTKPNQLVSHIGQAASSRASGNIRGAVPNLMNAGRSVGNAISRGAGNRIANVASNVVQTANAVTGGNNGRAAPANQPQASAQLLSFLRSSPLLQSLLSSVVTGNLGTGLQIPQEDGSFSETNFIELLESLKYLTESAIIEADNAGFSTHLQIESEADRDTYIESIIEDISNYENSLLPNYDVISY